MTVENTHIQELLAELEEEKNVEDILEDEENIDSSRYEITSYGIDFDVEGLVKRINRGDIYIPPFQRDFVWKMPESSRLIESLLLGLPVPGIFLAQDPETKKMLVIDGQQRLLSLKFFYDGFFNPKEGDSSKRVFKLKKVKSSFEDRTYEDLDTTDRINLDNCVIHATVVKQDTPTEDDTSIYHIFERLNSGGRKLTPQEIRSAVYHGPLIELVKELNKTDDWRAIYGRENERMKDQELILRFFAMLMNGDEYKPPMKDFVNLFAQNNRSNEQGTLSQLIDLFQQCCRLFNRSTVGRPFRLGTALNVAFYEAAMVGLATHIMNNEAEPNESFVKQAYDKLIDDEDFLKAISQSTGNPSSVSARLSIAKRIFME